MMFIWREKRGKTFSLLGTYIFRGVVINHNLTLDGQFFQTTGG